MSVKASSSAARTFRKLVFDTERVEYHGDVQPRNTSTDNAYRELGNVWTRRGRNDEARIDRRPRLLWVRIGVDETFHGVLSGLGERLRAWVGWRRRDLAFEDVDCDQPTSMRVEWMILKWKWTYESSYSGAPAV